MTKGESRRHPRPGKQSRKRTGASCVELAFVSPILFLIVFGVIEIAYGYMVHHLIQDAARQGCRLAVCSGQSDSTVTAKINSLLQAEHITGSTTSVQVNSTNSDVSAAKSGDLITVTISIPASKVTFFPTTGYLKGTLTAHCTLRHD